MAPCLLLTAIRNVLQQPNLPTNDRRLFENLHLLLINHQSSDELECASRDFGQACIEAQRRFGSKATVYDIRHRPLVESWNRAWSIITNATAIACPYAGTDHLSDHALLRVLWAAGSNVVPTPETNSSTLQSASSSCLRECESSARYDHQCGYAVKQMKRRLKSKTWINDTEAARSAAALLDRMASNKVDTRGRWTFEIDKCFKRIVVMVDDRATMARPAGGSRAMKNLINRLMSDSDLRERVSESLNASGICCSSSDVQLFLRLLIESTATSIWKLVSLKFPVKKREKHQVAFRAKLKVQALR